MQGSRLGPYTLLAELGSGGMGKVYRAEVTGEVSGLEPGRVVALKIIHAHLLKTPGFFKRFLREADIGRGIEHENVVRTYDCDALLHEGTQQNFLVMEYVEGRTLRDLLKELERVPEELCRHIGGEVAKGLAAIHAAGVIHRDLKPENVLITPDHVVKVMDLGVARLQDEQTRLSQAGAFVGSLEYAAPEQFRGQEGEADGRADLHGLGVVLYELATGHHPYRDESAPKLLHNILNADPRKAGEINPQLSPFFEELVHTLMAKDVARRIQAASRLVLILDDGEKSEWWRERARALRVETRRPLRRIRIPRETALYGRDEELEQLQALYESARDGDGQVLLIEGEAGIGKTRLVDEFVGRLQREGEDLNFLFGAYPPGGAATAAGAFATAYREHFGREGLEETLEGYLPATPILIAAFAALLRGELAPTGEEPLTRDSLPTVFVRATQALAAERPTIVLIDDLQFAPEEGRALFASLALAAPGLRLLLIGTTRRGSSEGWLAELQRLRARRLALARLGPKDLAKLLNDAFQSVQLAEELGHRIALKSDGNPYFAFEIIRGLREGQLIRQTADGSWSRTSVIEDIHIPASVTDLIRSRLGELSDEERNQLEVASCYGFEFDPLLVGTVLGTDPISTLQRFGAVEKKFHLVHSAGANYTFDHHQVQEVLYQSMHQLLREQYHAEIASVLQARADAADREPEDLDGALCVALCDHFLKGGQGPASVRYLGAALSQLAGSYLHGRRVELGERALDMPGLLEGEERIEILLRLDTSLQALGRREAREARLEECAALIAGRDDAILQARVRMAQGSFFWGTARYKEAEREYKRARALAREAGDRGQEAAATNGLANVLADLGRLGEAEAHYKSNLALAREIGDRQAEAGAVGNLGLVFEHQGRAAEALAWFEQCLALSRELGHRLFEVQATGNLGYALRSRGHNAKALALFERALEMAVAIGYRQGEAKAAGNVGLAWADQGRHAEAMPYFERCIEISREIGSPQTEATAVVDLANTLRQLGALEEATGHYRHALELGERQGRGHSLIGLGDCAENAGDAEEAERLIREALDNGRSTGEQVSAATAMVSLAGLLAGTVRGEEAAPLLDEALALVRGLDAPGTEAEATCLRARFAGGDADAARELLRANRERIAHEHLLRAHFELWRATGDSDLLEEAKRLLDHFVDHAPEEYRESTQKHVRLHRDILAAWKEHGEQGGA